MKKKVTVYSKKDEPVEVFDYEVPILKKAGLIKEKPSKKEDTETKQTKKTK